MCLRAGVEHKQKLKLEYLSKCTKLLTHSCCVVVFCRCLLLPCMCEDTVMSAALPSDPRESLLSRAQLSERSDTNVLHRQPSQSSSSPLGSVLVQSPQVLV